MSVSSCSPKTDVNYETLGNWKDLKKCAAEIRILGGEFSETRVIYVVYDETNESTFEARICINCGSRSYDHDVEKTLSHKFSCRQVEVVAAIGDHISAENSSCFEGLKIRDLSRIFIAAQLAQLKTELEEDGLSPETTEEILKGSIPDGFSYEKSPIIIDAKHLNW